MHFLWWEPGPYNEADEDSEMHAYLELFQLDPEEGHMIAFVSLDFLFPKEPERILELLQQAEVILTCKKLPVYSDSFVIGKAGEEIIVKHPETGSIYTLEVISYERNIPSHIIDRNREKEDFHDRLRYKITPPLDEEAYEIYDCGYCKELFEGVSVPGLLSCDENNRKDIRTVHSQIRRQPAEEITWRIKFLEADSEEMRVGLGDALK